MDRRLQNKKDIPFQHKEGQHTFDLLPVFKNKDVNDVYECYVPTIEGVATKMSAKKFGREELLIRIKESNSTPYHFVPLSSFCKDNNFYGIGEYLGEPLVIWITNLSDDDRWKLNSKLEVEQFGPHSFPIVRKVAEALNCHHQKTRALGLRINEMYIKGDSFKLLDPHFNSSAAPEPQILTDLDQFKSLVNQVAGSRTSDPNLILFNALFPSRAEFAKKNLDEIKLISYIICHSPFFWGMNERVKFANAYDDMRSIHGNGGFDNDVKLNQGIFEIVNWWRNVPTNPNDPINECYNFIVPPMKQSHLLMSFIRHCYQHYYEKSYPQLYTQLDEDLLNLFPYAFGKVYGLIYSKVNVLANINPPLTLSKLTQILKKRGLNYAGDGRC